MKFSKLIKFLRNIKKIKDCIWFNLIILAFPIAIYLLFQHLCSFIDYFVVGETITTKNIKQTISYMKQTQKFLQSIGIGLGSAGIVLVAREYKKNKKELAIKYATLSFILVLLISFLFFLFLYCGVLLPYPFCNIFLNKAYHSDGGLKYYFITLITFVFITINTLYISLERSKGKKKFLLILNLIIIISKIFFSYFYKIFYGKYISVVHLAYANLWSHLIITLIAFYHMFFNFNNEFRIQLKKITFSKNIILQIIKLSMTIVIGKTTYDYGKKVILDMANSFYGKESIIMITIGFVSLINGICYSISQSFEEAQTLMVSQSIVLKNKKETLKIFKNVLFITFIIAIFGFLINKFIGEKLLKIIQNGKSLSFEEKKGFTIGIFWEQTSLITSIWASLMINFIIAYTKKANIVFWINLLRINTRIFFFWTLYQIREILEFSSYTQFGLSTFLSNFIILIIITIIFIFFLKKKDFLTKKGE
ncbi:matE family protein [Candidatus Phytoplasma oryzae]|uniref:Probable multidrug resistance protein NorM n=1 Tax=Candidatus Phytoplasma oryzae TaxID=203274 RepID=A0A139JR36_9MOLU|nr:MATE family efflux transporter [Candidatus Phytoplasma oryzae]KXT29443.1 matE family protein [Candidatus Phytoplasma oryzae]RAM58023.1 hypothetical protein DH96_00505 [Candidatus Phytoplasma oryzae]